MAGVAGVTWITYREGKKLERSWEDPKEAESRTRKVLAYEELPEGYYALGSFSLPFVMDMALIGDEPPKPSTRLTQSKDGLAGLAAKRRTEPRKLGAEVRGDLDWIVMRCLEKDRTRRYDSAGGLAKDVERFLRDDPVEACPPGAGYRFRKFLRRNRAAVTATAVVLVAMILAVVGQTWNLMRAWDAERRATYERNNA